MNEPGRDKKAVESAAAFLLQVKGLSKHYPGFDLKDISFSVEAGSIVGFIGRNGAGKSTTLKCLEGSVHPDRGTITYFGVPFAGHEQEVKRRIGFELGGAEFYRSKKVGAIARVTARFYADWDPSAYEMYCKKFNLDQEKRIRDLSQGMRVKFVLALALSRPSSLLILDEPTSGLDPVSREEVLDIFLHSSRMRNTGILFSTHITSDLETCADHILYLDDGKIKGQGPLQSFKGQYRLATLNEAHAHHVTPWGTRATATQTTVLIPASSGIGRPATLDEIMIHLEHAKEDEVGYATDHATDYTKNHGKGER